MRTTGSCLRFVLVAALSLSAAGCSTSDDGAGDGHGDGGDGDGSSGADAAPPADARPPPVCSDGPAVGLSSDVQPIFNASCTDTACHDATGSAAQLDLTEQKAHANLVGATAFQCDRTLVVAGDLEESYLINKLTGIDMCSGTLMPKAGMALPDDELEVILAWVCQGAAND